ncbi:NHL repeat protein [Bacteroides finegoldii]|uniref:IPT/TIG domain-containing protein n=2 Tax=Bacteroides finegoldii TaxID=338188 RepID=K5C9J9_9BACE|nr:IPT/TIG domain-containing protein [Bacteroides finegoldii]EKJ89439.1 hypothetical protein HMPREF1057_02980 [Bacteroides finegoldii CL09T03C10]
MNDFFKSCLRWQMAFCLALGIAFAACNDDNNEGLPDDTTPQHSFEVADFTPIKGPRDTEVTLNGKNFGTDKESVKVFFNEKEATVVSVTDDKIVVRVPGLPGEECFVKVEIDGEEVKCKQLFDYIIQMYVSTLVGGKFKNEGGTDKPDNKPIVTENPTGEIPLAEAKFCGKMESNLNVDKDGNVYFVVKQGGDDYVYKANSETGLLTHVGKSNVGNVSLTLGMNPVTGTLYAVRDQSEWGDLVIYDQENGWFESRTEDEKFKWDKTAGFPSGIDAYGARKAITVRPSTGEIFMFMKGALGSLEVGERPWIGKNLGIPTDKVNGKFSRGMVFDVNNDNILYFSVEEDGRIFKYNIETKECTRLAGSDYGNLPDLIDGDLGGSTLNHPCQICMDSQNNIYVADRYNCCIRKISLDAGTITTFAGKAQTEGYQDGLISEALFDDPMGIAVDKNGVIYVADSDNYAIRRIALE